MKYFDIHTKLMHIPSHTRNNRKSCRLKKILYSIGYNFSCSIYTTDRRLDPLAFSIYFDPKCHSAGPFLAPSLAPNEIFIYNEECHDI